MPEPRALTLSTLLVLVSCTQLPTPDLPRPALPLPEALAAPFARPAGLSEDYLVPLDRQRRIFRGRLRAGPELPEFHLMLPSQQPAPTLLLLPILASGEFLMWEIAEFMASRGYAVVWAQRVASAMKEHQTVPMVNDLFRRSVLHNRLLFDWVRRQDFARDQPVGLFGISTGGILAGTLLGLEPELQAGVLVLAGGDLPAILEHSSEGRIRRWRRHRRKVQGLSAAELQGEMREVLRSDPARMGPYIDTRKVLMIDGRFDSVIPSAQQDILWEALGRPARLRYPLGHYTAVLAIWDILPAAEEFLAARLKP